MDPLLGQKVLLLVFYLGRVVEGRVHIPVALGVRDALHGLGCGLSECDGRVGALDGKELKLLPGVFALLSLCAGRRLLLSSSQKKKPVPAVGIPIMAIRLPMLISIIDSPHKIGGPRAAALRIF